MYIVPGYISDMQQQPLFVFMHVNLYNFTEINIEIEYWLPGIPIGVTGVVHVPAYRGVCISLFNIQTLCASRRNSGM